MPSRAQNSQLASHDCTACRKRAQLQEILRLDPENVAARDYLKTLSEPFNEATAR